MSTSDLELLGAGREAEIFAWKDGRALRLARDPSNGAMIDREVSALAAAQQAGAHVPRVYERVTVDGRPGVVLDRVDGIDLLGSLAGRPWTVRAVGKTLGVEHAACTGSRRQPGSRICTTSCGIGSRRRSCRTRCGRVPSRASKRYRPATGSCTATSIRRTCSAAANGYVVIDWTNGMSGDPAADVARTILLMGGGKLADGTPVVVRVLAPVVRRPSSRATSAPTRASCRSTAASSTAGCPSGRRRASPRTSRRNESSCSTARASYFFVRSCGTHQPSTTTSSAIRPAPTIATQASADSAVAVRNAV